MDLPSTPPAPSLPPADWYPDPENPGKLRYWDGAVWTDHRHTEGATTPDIDHFFKRTFGVLKARWKPLLIIAGLLGFPAALISTVGPALVMRDWVINFDDTPGADEPLSFEGFSSTNSLLGAGIVVVLFFLSFWHSASVGHQLHDAHERHSPEGGASASASITVGLRRMLPLAGLSILIVLALVAASVVPLIAAFVFPPLLLVTIPALIALFFWGWVKTAFLPVAVVSHTGTAQILKASAAVSKGRFWPIFGRLFLLAIVLVAIQIVSNIVTTIFGGDGALGGQEFGTNNSFVFADLFPSVGASIPLSVLSWVVSSAGIVIYISGLAMLFVAAHDRRVRN